MAYITGGKDILTLLFFTLQVVKLANSKEN